MTMQPANAVSSSETAGTPRVSIIIPTYNWSTVIGCAITSVLWQTMPDFELLVIGDGCTDDTAEVVAAFGDPRIRWHNLPKNSGSQSVPNNTGIAMARAPYIAYLGHDDIWYPTHLALMLDAIEQARADLAAALCVIIGPPGSGIRALRGMSTPDRSAQVTPPSATLHRRALTDEIGEWRDYRTIVLPPDAEFHGRARAAGKQYVHVPELTVFKFPSAWRRNSYVEKPSAEQLAYLERIEREPDFLYQEMKAIALAYATNNTTYTVPMPKDRRLMPGATVEAWRKERGLPSNVLENPNWKQRLGIARRNLNRRIPRQLRLVSRLRRFLRR